MNGYHKIAMMAVITIPTPVAAFSSNPYSDWNEVKTEFVPFQAYATLDTGTFSQPTQTPITGSLPLAAKYAPTKHTYKAIRVAKTFYQKRWHGRHYHVYRMRKLVTVWVKTKHPSLTALQAIQTSMPINQSHRTRVASLNALPSTVSAFANIDSNSSADFWNADRGTYTPHLIATEQAITRNVLPTRQYYAQRIAEKARARGDIPVELALAVTYQESRFNPKAVSPVGARSLMQVMPATFKSEGCSGDVNNPDDNMDCGLHYLAKGYNESGKDVGAAARFYFGGPNPALHGRKTAQYERDIKRNLSRFTSL